MPSADGHGQARERVLALLASWLELEDGWAELDDAEGGTWERILMPYARWGIKGFSDELVGFWVLWHAEGGFEGMRRVGMSEATIWRRVKAFRDAFGKHPDDYEFPGLSIDLDRYWTHPEGHGFIGNPAQGTVE